MAISNDELFKMVEKLPDSAKKSAYDFLKFLATHQSQPDWDEISEMTPDTLPLSEEEKSQLRNSSEFVSWEEAMRELELPTDTES